MPYVNFRNRRVAVLTGVVVLLSCLALWWLVSLVMPDMPAEGELGHFRRGITGFLPGLPLIASTFREVRGTARRRW